MPLEETAALSSAGDSDRSGNSTKAVRVRSKDLFEFELTLAAAKLSGTLRNALKVDGEEESEGRPAIPSHSLKENHGPVDLDRVGKIGLEKVVAFLNHYATEPMGKIPEPMEAVTFEEVGTFALDECYTCRTCASSCTWLSLALS
jgi:hypothetical protein